MKVLAVMPSYEGDLELVGVSDIGNVLKGPGGKLMKAAEEIVASASVNVTTDTEQGVPYEKIIDVAEEERCDLIVMGRRGLRRIERVLMGSVTSRVISHSSCDVLVVPRGASIGWKKNLLATDGSEPSARALDRAADFTSSYGGELAVLSVADVPAEFLGEAPDIGERLMEQARERAEEAKRHAAQRGVTAEALVRQGDAHQVIVDVAAELGADVIFMGPRGRKGVKKLIMGSVTEKVIGYATCPVLVVH
jgi:nucleotide-binding universal stress UspA family protein